MRCQMEQASCDDCQETNNRHDDHTTREQRRDTATKDSCQYVALKEPSCIMLWWFKVGWSLCHSEHLPFPLCKKQLLQEHFQTMHTTEYEVYCRLLTAARAGDRLRPRYTVAGVPRGASAAFFIVQ